MAERWRRAAGSGTPGPYMLRAIGILAVSCLIVGCDSSSGTLGSVAVPTLLTVDPATFRGAIGCGPGGLQMYVVALTDVTDPSLPSPVAVSAPATCPNPTSFGLQPIQIDHSYTAEIDGYDRADLTPSGPGSRALLDPQGNPVAPRWRTTCGIAPTATSAPAVSSDAGGDSGADASGDSGADASGDSGADASGDSGIDGSLPTTTSHDTRLITRTRALVSTEVIMHSCLLLADAPPPDAGTPADDAASGETGAAVDDATGGGKDDSSSLPADATDDAAQSTTTSDSATIDGSDAAQNGQ